MYIYTQYNIIYIVYIYIHKGSRVEHKLSPHPLHYVNMTGTTGGCHGGTDTRSEGVLAVYDRK